MQPKTLADYLKMNAEDDEDDSENIDISNLVEQY